MKLSAWKNLGMFALFAFITSVTSYGQILESDEGLKEADEEPRVEFDTSKYVDGIVERTIIQNTRVLPYEPVREADIPWEKRVWRILDVREKMNLPFVYPNRPFFQILAELALDGKILVFKDDNFRSPLTREGIEKLLYRVDTVTQIDEETYEERITIVHNEINYEDIKKYRIKEVWFFDEEASRVMVRILGIAPILDVYDPETGDFKYSLPMFWVYFPEARKYLAHEPIFVDYNDVSPMTWQDLFEGRYFSSYIYKITNPLDLRIEDYVRTPVDDPLQEGIDRLLESEQFKNYLLDFEQDLWSY